MIKPLSNEIQQKLKASIKKYVSEKLEVRSLSASVVVLEDSANNEKGNEVTEEQPKQVRKLGTNNLEDYHSLKKTIRKERLSDTKNAQ